MDMLLELWLPIVLSAVALFFASFLAWAVLPHHKPDWKKLPDEATFMERLKAMNVPPGQYIFPMVGHEEAKDPEKKRLLEGGCLGTLNVWPGPPNMAANMALSVLYFLIVSVFCAYIGAFSVEPGEDFGRVFQIMMTTGVLAFCAGGVLNDIWFRKPARAMLMNFIDGVAYSAVLGVIFALLWPGLGEAIPPAEVIN
jgi:hypothetical protein